MKSSYRRWAFLVVVLGQIGFLGYMIYGQERIAWQGELYRFRTRPIDPRDPFRGQYVNLSFEIEQYTPTQLPEWLKADQLNQKIFVRLERDDAGFAKVAGLSQQEPEGDYVQAWLSNYHPGDDQLWLDFPFDRYYMEETKAQPAEEALNQVTADSLHCWAEVRVLDGKTVLRDVKINGQSLKNWVTTLESVD